MAYGSGATLLSKVQGSDQWVTDPRVFWRKTRKDHKQVATHAAPGEGKKIRGTLGRAGLYTRLFIMFDGQVTVSTAAVTLREGMPYSLIEHFKLSAQGSEIFSLSGVDLKVLDHCRYPAFVDQTDDLPAATTVAGGENLAVGTHDVALTWVVPISPDDMTCNAGLYGQSSAITLSYEIVQATDDDLCSNGANFTVTGDFIITAEVFEIPTVDGRVVVPDLTALHKVIATDEAIQGGTSRLELLRAPGNLLRLFLSGRSANFTPVVFRPEAAAANRVLTVELEYGVNQRPFSYDPAWWLTTLNNRWYGTAVPYDRVVMDFIKENPERDAVHMQSLSELALKVKLDPSVAITASQAQFHVLLETIG